MARKKKIEYIYAVGRRREASARVRLHKGKGDHEVNGLPLADYFPGEANLVIFTQPFVLTGTEGKYYVTVKVAGGGKRGQLGASVLGIARALEKVDKDFRTPLKKAGLISRDERKKERRKVGTGGKARRKKQSPKR